MLESFGLMIATLCIALYLQARVTAREIRKSRETHHNPLLRALVIAPHGTTRRLAITR
ncbi:hypothetical protein AB9K41_00345 [Cribrihabitans sp. XS_ASV171]